MKGFVFSRLSAQGKIIAFISSSNCGSKEDGLRNRKRVYFEKERGEVEKMNGDKSEVEGIVPVTENAVMKLRRTHASI